MRKKAIVNLLLLFLSIGIMYSCKKAENLESIDAAEDDSNAQNEFNFIFQSVDDVSQEDQKGKVSTTNENDLPECAVSTFSNDSLIIDFGTDPCLCKDGNYRNGKIIAVFEGDYKNKTKGSKVTITLEDYVRNEKAIEGKKIVEIVETPDDNKEGYFKFTWNVQNASVATDIGTFTWKSSFEITRTEGNETISPFDDTYEVTGESSGINRRGVAFTSTILTPLKKVRGKVGCSGRHAFVSGTFKITTKNDNTLEVNYDPDNNEACDRKASVSFNGGTEKTFYF